MPVKAAILSSVIILNTPPDRQGNYNEPSEIHYGSVFAAVFSLVSQLLNLPPSRIQNNSCGVMEPE